MIIPGHFGEYVYHKIKRIIRPTWTLVFHGPKRETWGYLTEDGWMDYKTYREEKRKGRWNESVAG